MDICTCLLLTILCSTGVFSIKAQDPITQAARGNVVSKVQGDVQSKAQSCADIQEDQKDTLASDEVMAFSEDDFEEWLKSIDIPEDQKGQVSAEMSQDPVSQDNEKDSEADIIDDSTQK
jgi:hypothetical protein